MNFLKVSWMNMLSKVNMEMLHIQKYILSKKKKKVSLQFVFNSQQGTAATFGSLTTFNWAYCTFGVFYQLCPADSSKNAKFLAFNIT